MEYHSVVSKLFEATIKSATLSMESLQEGKSPTGVSLSTKPKYHMGVTLSSLTLPSEKGLYQTTIVQPNTTLPPSYSTRLAYPNCSLPVHNQGECGSCWAVTAVDMLGDRACIQTGIKFPFSPQPLISCVTRPNGADEDILHPFSKPECFSLGPAKVLKCACGDAPTQVPPSGCFGNSMMAAWDYLKNYGTVPFLDMGPYANQVSCKNFCTMSLGFPSFSESVYLTLKTRGLQEAYHLADPDIGLATNIEAMKTDLLAFGPIQGAFSVYQSFFDFFEKYPTGIYAMDFSSRLQGGHTSKIVGWGVQKDEVSNLKSSEPIEYWLLQNTWGPDWGDKGFFKMAMTKPKDLPKLTQAKAFVVEYNAIATILKDPDAYRRLIVPKILPIKLKKSKAEKHIGFWIGAVLTGIVLLLVLVWVGWWSKSIGKT